MKFSTGKLPHEFFETLLFKGQKFDDSVILGPGTGIDCAVLDVGNQYLVVKSDPITFATNQIGWYAVNVNANDIVTTGAKPKWFMATVLLPENKTDEAMVEDIFQQIKDACRAIDVDLVGGHTEVTFGIDRPIISGTMMGLVDKDKLIRQDQIENGDDILLTKGAPIEGISIIANEFEKDLMISFSKEEIEFAKEFLHNPGISVYKDALSIAALDGVHAMHDPTEGGIFTALWEMAQASELTVDIQSENIIIPEIGKKLCNHYSIDPYRTIASGALLIFCSKIATNNVINTLKKENIDCFKIGTAVDGKSDLIVDGEVYTKVLRDEINKLF